MPDHQGQSGVWERVPEGWRFKLIQKAWIGWRVGGRWCPTRTLRDREIMRLKVRGYMVVDAGSEAVNA